MGAIRRKYSRNGCLECKKRKIKCDERDPSCLNCIRSSKNCHYNVLGHKEGCSNSTVKPFFEVRFFNPKEKFVNKSSEDIKRKKNVPEKPCADQDMKHLFEEAGELVNEINEMMALFDDDTNMKTEHFEQKERLTSDMSPLEMTISANSLSPEIGEYLVKLATTSISFHLYPFASLVEANEVVSLLLVNLCQCQHLLYALLALSATFQYNQAVEQTFDQARQRFLKTCLQKLYEAFSKNKDDESYSYHIEKLLLTVLTITTYFTASADNDNIASSWGIHLRGARNLLTNYGRLNTSHTSRELAFAKTWFFALEAIATLYSPFSHFEGGSIFEDSGRFDNTQNPAYHKSLCELGLVVRGTSQSDYNLYLGYTVKGVNAIICYTNTLNLINQSKQKKASMRQTDEVMGLLNEAASEKILEGVGDDYIIRQPNHFPTSCFALDHGNWFSWVDACNQLHVEALHLLILLLPKFFELPRDHHLVQETKNRILGTSFFIRRKPKGSREQVVAESEHFFLPQNIFDNRCIMVQSAFRLCASVVDASDEFEMIHLFFTGLVRLGNGSSLHALKQVEEIMLGRGKTGFQHSVPFA